VKVTKCVDSVVILRLNDKQDFVWCGNFVGMIMTILEK